MEIDLIAGPTTPKTAAKQAEPSAAGGDPKPPPRDFSKLMRHKAQHHKAAKPAAIGPVPVRAEAGKAIAKALPVKDEVHGAKAPHGPKTHAKKKPAPEQALPEVAPQAAEARPAPPPEGKAASLSPGRISAAAMAAPAPGAAVAPARRATAPQPPLKPGKPAAPVAAKVAKAAMRGRHAASASPEQAPPGGAQPRASARPSATSAPGPDAAMPHLAPSMRAPHKPQPPAQPPMALTPPGEDTAKTTDSSLHVEIMIETKSVEPAHMSKPAANVPPIADQIAAQMPHALPRTEKQTIELRLDPPELGRVTIHLTPHDHQVTAHVIAERADTADLMRRHAEVLTASLARAGFSQADLSFQQGQSQDADTKTPRYQGFVSPADSTAAPAPTPTRMGTGPDGRLDIRL